MKERQFVDQLQRRFPSRAPVLLGIGDDGAVIDSKGQPQQVIVTDMLLDGVHFDLKVHAPRLVGRKSVAVNLSDLAAMGCRPTAAFVSLAIPREMSAEVDDFLEQIYSGIEDLANEFDFTIAGGDTNVWHGPFAINVCCTGVPFGDRVLLRSTAQAGDIICVTGALGGSYQSGRHLTFPPRFKESAWLSNQSEVHAVMDISDGLAIDLHRLCAASGVGARIFESCVPVNSVDEPAVGDSDPLESALHDGEDFELLITVSPSFNLASPPFPLWKVGDIRNTGDGITRSVGEFDKQSQPLVPGGWQHNWS